MGWNFVLVFAAIGEVTLKTTMQQNSQKYESVRTEVIGGKRYIVISHYVGKKDFKKIVGDHAFQQAIAENKKSA